MLNKVTAIGNLGRDPEMKYTPSGQAITNFSLATNHQFTRSDDSVVKQTTWIRVSCWGRLAEVVNEHLKQGSKVYVEGRLNPDEFGNPRVWMTDEGEARSNFEITAQEVKFLDGRNDS